MNLRFSFHYSGSEADYFWSFGCYYYYYIYRFQSRSGVWLLWLRRVMLFTTEAPNQMLVYTNVFGEIELLWKFRLSGGSMALSPSLDNQRGQLTDQGGFCNINCPPPVYSLAPFPISDCERRLHLPVVSRVYFGGGSLRHFCLLWIGYYAAEHLGRGVFRVKAFSVSVSMCALYSSVCVYASASYGCFLAVQGVLMYAICVNVPLCATPRPGCISHLRPKVFVCS